MGFVEPAVLERFLVETCPGVRRRKRDLDRVRIDLGGEAYGLLDGLARLSGQTKDEGAVNGDAELMTVRVNRFATSIRMPFLML